MATAARIFIDQKSHHRLAELEAWAVSQPYQRLDPQAEAAELHRTRRERDNRESFAMSAAMALPPAGGCGHCAACRVGGGHCLYR